MKVWRHVEVRASVKSYKGGSETEQKKKLCGNESLKNMMFNLYEFSLVLKVDTFS